MDEKPRLQAPKLSLRTARTPDDGGMAWRPSGSIPSTVRIFSARRSHLASILRVAALREPTKSVRTDVDHQRPTAGLHPTKTPLTKNKDVLQSSREASIPRLRGTSTALQGREKRTCGSSCRTLSFGTARRWHARLILRGTGDPASAQEHRQPSFPSLYSHWRERWVVLSFADLGSTTAPY